MKKCSKSHHESLAELNITPLLDLAFVLLVIFIITTTPLVNDMNLDLPHAAMRLKEPKPKVNFVTVQSDGSMYLNKDVVDTASLQEKLIALREKDPDLNVVVRGDSRTKYQNIVAVMDVLQQANVGKVNLATEPYPDGAVAKEKE
jgi:biopolymer transport protein ExbD